MAGPLRPSRASRRYAPRMHEIEPIAAPGSDPFEAALTAAIERLPDDYRAQLETVAIVVADEASPEELASTGAHGLLGLYRGVPRTVLGAGHAAIPSVITLYRGPSSASTATRRRSSPASRTRCATSWPTTSGSRTRASAS